MSQPHAIADAMQRAVSVFTRRPDKGLHDDVSARACWQDDMRVVATHASGVQVESDMPVELGGTGDRPSPGWFFRAGIAACATTAIAMVAAEQDIAPEAIEVEIGSRTDTRGLLGMSDADGTRITAAPASMQVDIVLRAPGVDVARLRALVAEGLRRSPMQGALAGQPPIAVAVSIADGKAG